MDSRKCQTATATPAKPGGLPLAIVGDSVSVDGAVIDRQRTVVVDGTADSGGVVGEDAVNHRQRAAIEDSAAVGTVSFGDRQSGEVDHRSRIDSKDAAHSG